MFDLAILTSYSFLVVAIGTFVLAIAAGAVGCITVLKGQSLIGDAIGHSSFPGIVLAFMIFMQRTPALLLLGALFSGSVAFILIQVIHKNSKLPLDAILAIILSSFFGLGMVLKSHIQGSPTYSGASQAGIQNYIFGQAAYIMKNDVKLIMAISIMAIILIVLFYKEIKVFVFDEVYSRTIGINSKLMYSIIMICAMSLIAVGLKIVGAILISSLLIVPAITAMQWTNNFFKALLISGAVGGVSSVIGTYLSTVISGMSTGPTIILVMSIFAFISLIFGPRGMISKYIIRKRYVK